MPCSTSRPGWSRSTGGGWAPWFWAHESQLHRVDDDVPDERAVLIEPLADLAVLAGAKALRANGSLFVTPRLYAA